MSSCGKILRASLKILMLFVWLLKPNLKFWIGFQILAKMTLTCEGGGHHTDKKSRWSNQINFWLLLSSIHQPPKYEFLWLLRGTRGIFKGAQSKSEPVSEKKNLLGDHMVNHDSGKTNRLSNLIPKKQRGCFEKSHIFHVFFSRWICFSFLFSGLIT